MTYRTGNHWGVTIVREGEVHTAADLDDCAFCCTGGSGCPIHQAAEAELVALVVNGDQALAERICALLNAEPRCLEPTCPDFGDPNFGEGTCPSEHADAPSHPLVSPESVQNGPAVPEATPDAHSGPEGRTRPVIDMTETALRVAARTVTAIRPGIETHTARAAIQALLTMGWRPPETRGCICNDPPPTVDKPKNGTASRPPGWACPRHGMVI